MNQNDGLLLKDIHLPEAVFWWPPAVGWWFLIALFLLVLTATILHYLFRRKRRMRQHLLSEINQIRLSLELTGDTHQCARSLSKLLKQLALHVCPAICPASTGSSWLIDLKTSELINVPQHLEFILLEAPYSKTIADSAKPDRYLELISMINKQVLSKDMLGAS